MKIIVSVTIFSILTLVSLNLIYPSTNSSISNSDQEESVYLDVDINKEIELQKAVDHGHQPWRLDPIDVAHVAVLQLDHGVEYNSCQLLFSMGNDARVQCKNDKVYIVHLTKFIKNCGIWTATLIEMHSK